MYGANLNHGRVTSYLNLLKNKGFIKSKEASKTNYTTTEKGENFLQHFQELKKEFENSTK